MAGIYKITIADKFYYGQSMDCNKRRREHLYLLKQGKHCNYYMQSAWNKYMDFKFEVIEEVEDLSLLDEREQHYIDLYFDDVSCMNLARCAEASARGRKHTDEAKAKMSASGRGTMRSAKAIAAKSKQVQVTYPDGSVEVFASAKETGLKFGVSCGTISDYCTGKNPQPGTGYPNKKTAHINNYIFHYTTR
jgi:hypothetical protein